MIPTTYGCKKIAPQMALQVMEILAQMSFNEQRAIPTSGNHSGAAVDIAEAICYGVDLDALATFPQDFIYKRQSLLHLLATIKPQSYESPNYELVERAVELLATPKPDTGACRFDLDQVDGVYGFTPLHYAVCNASPRMIEALLTAGASVDVRVAGGADQDEFAGQSALDLATINNRPDVAQMLRAWSAGKAVQGVLNAAANKPSGQD